MKMRTLYELTPKTYRKIFSAQIAYAGFKEASSNRIVSMSYFLSLFVSVSFLLISIIIGFMPIGLFLSAGIGIGIIAFTYLIFMFIADSRTSQIENVLPDALQLMSANIRAGMTIDRAIWLSARPEFGVLEDEIKLVGARTIGGKPLKVALTDMTKTINSKILDRTIKLLLEGIESGGELAHLLEEVAANIRVTQTLKKEIKSSVMAYSLFIMFAAVVAAPFLFSISIFFVDTMTNLWGSAGMGLSNMGSSSVGMGGFLQKAKGPSITSDELFLFAIVTLAVTSFFGSMTMSLIQSGKEKNGLKIAPFLMIVAIAILLISNLMVKSLFKSFFLI
jgi:archaeal flagellar protein FlaJ